MSANSKPSLFLSSPLHDGRAEAGFLCASIDLDRQCRTLGIPVCYYFNNGESLIQRARNNIAQVFLGGTCPETGEPWTHLLMVDQDMGWNPGHVLRLMELMDADHQIIAGAAPVRGIDWEAVQRAAKEGRTDLDRAGSRMVVNTLPDQKPDGPLVEVQYCGTGFIMIARAALLRFQEAYPELRYKPDYQIGSKEFDEAHTITAFFDCIICPQERRYLSEDYTFCNRMRHIGIRPYVCRDVLLPHIGKYAYQPTGF